MTIELYKNTLVMPQEAQVYFEERFDSDKWFELDDVAKEKLLITASKRVSVFDYVGNKEDESQLLAFPRDFETPQDIKDAVCEEAISLAELTGNVHGENKKQGITSISLGVGSVSYAAGVSMGEAQMLVSESAVYLVKKWVKKGYKFS